MRPWLLPALVAPLADSACAITWNPSSEALRLEGAVAPSDSGAPVFVEEKGELRLAGQTYDVIPGENGFFFGRVSRHPGWIVSVIAGPARIQKS